MAEKDYFVGIPKAIPVAGDNVLYSTRPFVDATNGRPIAAGDVQSGERSMNHIFGWFQANQDATLKIQGWDVVAKAWVTLNGNGSGQAAPAAGGACNVDSDVPGGDFQIAVNFAVPPTVWTVPDSFRLSKRQS